MTNKLTGNGRPSMHLKGEVGQYYEDLLTGDLYECRVASEFSKTNGRPFGGYVWELRAKGEDIREIYGQSSGNSQKVNWNDIEGKPFGAELNVLFEGDVDFSEDYLYNFQSSLGLEENKTYCADVDGVVYKSTAIFDADQGEICCYWKDPIGDNVLTLFDTYLQSFVQQKISIKVYTQKVSQLDEVFIEDAVYPKFGPFYASCNNLASTVDKKATTISRDYPIRVLRLGSTVNVRFKNTNTANSPTLNVDDTGTFPIAGYGLEIAEGCHGFVFTGNHWTMIY